MEKSKRVVGYARVSTEARKDRKSLNELLDVDDAVADMIIIVSELSVYRVKMIFYPFFQR